MSEDFSVHISVQWTNTVAIIDSIAETMRQTNAKLEALTEMVKEQTKMIQTFDDFLTQAEAEWTKSDIDASNEDNEVEDSGDVA